MLFGFRDRSAGGSDDTCRGHRSSCGCPLGDGTSEEQLANLTMQQNLARLSPGRLFTEATQALLDPSVRTLDVVGRVQVGTDNRAIASLLSLDQSLLVAWPQFVTLIALTAGMFALAYVSFMRQEVRA